MIHRLPVATVKIGAFDYALVPVREREAVQQNAHGQFIPVAQTIRIQVEGVTLHKVAHTILHELMHAIYAMWEMDGDDKEEAIVSKMSNGMAAVMRDNPRLARWLADALR